MLMPPCDTCRFWPSVARLASLRNHIAGLNTVWM